MSKRLLLVEDDPRLGPIMRDVLTAEWEVTLCPSAEEGLAAAAGGVFDVMVCDRRLPGMSGEDLVSTLRSRRMSLPILMLTALGQVHDKVEGLEAGANDYLVKPFEFEELTARLRALTRDYSGAAAGIDIGGWVFYPDDSCIESPYAGRIMLTGAETTLLAVLATQPQRTFSREQLLTAAFEHGASVTTVDTYVHYLRRKTDRDLITTVRGVGYRLGTPA
ncbi:response regulator transcription factor [Demequina capsici]|uniref:Response regulator transcription factor n=1 Tax=Demequina capsici TaxID=3075620 RepID=A0AA96F5X7_9MICO|nr:response regulator transcription factor [Demequina sp. OYTSA14]WNM24423.1 response regulator transcription factor [Demequina sp. OYTSA14]